MEQEYNSDDIQSLSAGEHIRMRPKLYFEKCFIEKSLNSLIFEVLCHAFDEYFDGNCDKVEIEVFNDSFIVNYNSGMSLKEVSDNFTKAELIMTKIAACKNEKKHLSVGEEFCELGMATINFASENCQLTTFSKGKKGIFNFINGQTISKQISNEEFENESTRIYLKPNKILFENLKFTIQGIKEKAEELNLRLENFKVIIIDRIVQKLANEL